MKQAVIITIGDELLIGQVIDTNSAYLAQQLNAAGFSVAQRLAVGDDAFAITNALDTIIPKTDLVLLTGGLGPTDDDKTTTVLANYFNTPLVENPDVLKHIQQLLHKRNITELNERNKKQALVPKAFTALQNNLGTAPGLFYEFQQNLQSKQLVALPGVPFEMKALFENQVLPRIQTNTSTSLHHKTMLLWGIGESALAHLLEDFEKTLPQSIQLAYLPNLSMIRLRLTDNSGAADTAMLDQSFSSLQGLVAPHIVALEDTTITEVVANDLLKLEKTVATAESCTGGLIASWFTAQSGASAYYVGSIIPYNTSLKTTLLGVPEKTIQEYGVVSESVAKDMLIGLLTKIQADYGIAVTGIMGPAGGTETVPVGTVWIAVGNAENYLVKKFHFHLNRTLNRELTAVTALNLLHKLLSS